MVLVIFNALRRNENLCPEDNIPVTISILQINFAKINETNDDIELVLLYEKGIK